jgi:malonate transporter and related proteins
VGFSFLTRKNTTLSPLLLFPDFAIIAMGYVLRRFWLGPEAWVTIEKLVYFVLFPCLLFFSVMSASFDIQAAGRFALGGPFIIVSAFILGLLGVWFSKLGRVDFSAGLQTAYRFNSYIGLALASRLGGQSAVTLLAILLAVGVPLCNILAVTSMSKGGRLGALLDVLKNPLIIGTGLGIAAQLTGVAVPQPVMQTLERLAQGAVSLGLLAVGAGLMFSGLKGNWMVSAWWLGIKLVVSPVMAVAYAHFTGLNSEQSLVLLVFSAIPSASSAYILAARMGGNAPLVACLISLSTVGAAISLPMALGLAQAIRL